MGQSIDECELLTGTRSAEGIMASGLGAAPIGRTHGCSDQRCDVLNPLTARSRPHMALS